MSAARPLHVVCQRIMHGLQTNSPLCASSLRSSTGALRCSAVALASRRSHRRSANLSPQRRQACACFVLVVQACASSVATVVYFSCSGRLVMTQLAKLMHLSLVSRFCCSPRPWCQLCDHREQPALARLRPDLRSGPCFLGEAALASRALSFLAKSRCGWRVGPMFGQHVAR